MKTQPFVNDDFLLNTPTARQFFHDVAAPLPIIDYHCHLNPAELADNRHFQNITELWIAHDPYKHRAMRIMGIPEEEITGPAEDRLRFQHWATVLPSLIGNPLHHWTSLELARYFDIDEPLNADSAQRIWDRCNEVLAGPEGHSMRLIHKTNVACICTSDRLCDDLQHHEKLAASNSSFQVLPSLRGDDIVAVESGSYGAWVKQLEEASEIQVCSWPTFTLAVQKRLDAYETLGCRLSDHSLDDFTFTPTSESETAKLWERRMELGRLATADTLRLKSGLLSWLGKQYAQRQWILQLHLGALRHTSSRLRQLAGPAGGYASMGNATDIAALGLFLDTLEKDKALPRTILYSLNPILNASLATLTGSFTEDGITGKIQLGPAWWYNDHASGIRNHLEAVSNYGLLSTFIGMTTDSRNILSLTRHEYFRRILCDWIGDRVEAGEFPRNCTQLESIVTAICHGNARQWILTTTPPAIDYPQ